MIFVTVGTTPFEGLIKAADELELKDDVIIQKAEGKYVPKNKEFFEYTDKFSEYLEKAEVVVTHGGAGTIYQLLGMGKKIVGVSNEERNDHHQWDLLKKMSEEGHLIWCKDLKDLGKCIEESKIKNFKKYVRPENKIPDEILNFVYDKN